MRISDYTNLNPRDEMAVKMKETVFAVEADRFAQSQLWNMHALGANFMQYVDPVFDAKMRYNWKQDNSGWSPTIGTFNGGGSKKYGVTMSMFWMIIDGQRVLFYHLTSRYQDHDLVREWLFKHMPQLFPNGIDSVGLLTDAMNFHTCTHYIRELNEPKGT